MLDDPCVVPGCKLVRSGTACKREQPREAKAAVAVDARVGCLPTFVTADERVDHGTPKLFAEVECDVRNAERVTRGTGSENRIGRATGALRVGPVRIEPEPQRDADGVRQGLEQRNGAVDTAAHRNRDPPGRTWRPKDGPDRVGKGVNSERLAPDRRSLEQRQSNERPIEPRSISLDNALSIEPKPHERKLSATRRISNELQHRTQASANRRECRLRRRSPTTALAAVKSSCRAAGAADFTAWPCRGLRPL
jgi:hypothetical protein